MLVEKFFHLIIWHQVFLLYFLNVPVQYINIEIYALTLKKVSRLNGDFRKFAAFLVSLPVVALLMLPLFGPIECFPEWKAFFQEHGLVVSVLFFLSLLPAMTRFFMVYARELYELGVY